MTGELTFTLGRVSPAVSLGWFAGGLLVPATFVSKVGPELLARPPRFFNSTYDPPIAAASTIRMMAKGRSFFMIKNAPPRAAFLGRRRPRRVLTRALVRACPQLG